jgi:glycosyltransferase involved in cell wall biosynthesis
MTSVGPNFPLVVHVVTALDFGGVERHMETIATNLERSQMRYLFVAISHGGATEVRMRELGADVICLFMKSKIPSARVFLALLYVFLKQQPFVVHTHGAEANFHGLLAAWFARVPVRVGEEIGMPSHRPLAKYLFKFVYHTAHQVIGVSRIVTDWLVNSGEVIREKVTTVENPVRYPLPAHTALGNSNFLRIIFIGRLEPVKNPLMLLDAFARVAKSFEFIELWILGDGTQRAKLEQFVRSSCMSANVKFFGYQSRPEDFIRQCNVCVQPSIAEGFSLSLIETMFCGVPVIATRVGAATEIIEHGVTGWLVERTEPEALAKALMTAVKLGPQRLSEIGLRARNSVLGRFDPKDYIKRLETLYFDLSKSPSR